MAFSSRTHWDQTPNELARRIAELRRAGEPILDLTESNPTACGFVYPGDEILGALSSSSALRYQPDPRGWRAAREVVARAHAGGAGLGPGAGSPDHVVLTASTSEAYSWLFKCLCEPGDEVLVPTPSYPLLDFIARLEGVRLVRYPLLYEDRWRLDLEALARAAGRRSRAVVVIQPNNPTGSYLDSGEIEALRAVCSRHSLPVISDEVFLDYPMEEPGPAPTGLLGLDGILVTSLGGLSKSVGLPQMKLSWILVSGPDPLREELLSRLELIGDTFLSVATPVQLALARILDAGRTVRDQILGRIRTNRRTLEQLRDERAAWEPLRTSGGWFAVVRAPAVLTDEEWALRLLDQDRVQAGARRLAERIAAVAG
jgi:alanine-synthesizing transaminase